MTTTPPKNPAAVALGRLGGLARKGCKSPGAGFAKPEILRKALETIQRNRLEKGTKQ